MNIENLTKTQIENNVIMSQSYWNKELKNKLNNIKSGLALAMQSPKISKDLKLKEDSSEQFIQEAISNLRERKDNYLMNFENVEKLYGLKFPDLQKQYEEMLPEINKYLGVQNE